jgi:hypothetical protein
MLFIGLLPGILLLKDRRSLVVVLQPWSCQYLNQVPRQMFEKVQPEIIHIGSAGLMFEFFSGM